jgi:GNAT superfamily N-acetyltransferase
MLNPWQDQPAYQLRGMAIDASRQRQGVGRALLAFGEQHVVAHTGITTLWCNARIGAAGFYTAQGWTQIGDAYDIAGVGPHVKLWHRLA